MGSNANHSAASSSLTAPVELVQDLNDEASSARKSMVESTPRNTTDMTAAMVSNSQQYVDWRVDQGNTTTAEDEKRAVQRYAREKLFAKVKFITCDSELEYTGKYKNGWVIEPQILLTDSCVIFQQHLKVGMVSAMRDIEQSTQPADATNYFTRHFPTEPPNCIAGFVTTDLSIPVSKWHLYKEVVRESIRIRRTNSNSCLKKEYHGKN
jgi:hypothetical protein